jgi:cell pole-organizing protein PopZ
MDEILASIRRIIAEDDDGAGKPQEASEQSAPEPQSEEAERSELAESIAETLHQEDAMASAVEEVLELTEEVEQIAVAASLAGDPPPQPEVSDVEAETATAPDQIPPELDEAEVVEVTEVTEVFVTEQVAFEADEGSVPPMGEIPGITQDAEFEVEQAPVAPSSIAEAVEAIVRGVEPAEAAPDEQSAPESQPDATASSSPQEAPAEAEALEVEAVQIVVEETSLEVSVDTSDAAEEEALESLADEEQAERAESTGSLDETLSTASNRPAAVGTAVQVPSLETSVKEMLRPMLREWLDDNLPRIIENAVKDEIASSDKQKD